MIQIRLQAFVLAFALLNALGSAFAQEIDRPITAVERSHWSFQPVVRPNVPSVKRLHWVRNPIDTFILNSLEQNTLSPAPEASRPTLLRRLTYDLTGLPPIPQELDNFLADTTAGAYERVVDRLLASPRYGERWAQHWLDLARYADTDGFEFDALRPDAWRYRDWVVSALNSDMPYDQFVRLQIAGDELAPDDPSALVATGFNRCYPDMVDLNDQTLRRQNALNDITETTGLVFLGLTIGCARCHDHKTDPIRQSDFYRLQAFFTPARFRDDLPFADSGQRLDHEQKKRDWVLRVAGLQTTLASIEEPVRHILTPHPPAGIDDLTAQALEKPLADRSPRETQLVYQARAKDRRIKPSVWDLVLDPFTCSIRESLHKRIDEEARREPRIAQTRGIDESGADSPSTYLLRRGELSLRGPKVEPAFPGVLRPDGSPGHLSIAPLKHSTGRRKALAEWLSRVDHPLTARVIVNRLWSHHFGRGIVASPSDFGLMGVEPSHPELLDWLASELPARGWSLKAMHRLMLTSSTYRQSSLVSAETLAGDPENECFSRFRRSRLDGEAIRDALLAISGTLSATMGGRPVRPELPQELNQLPSLKAIWPVSESREERMRRSLYVLVRRNLRYTFFEAFDRPDTNASCPRRSVTTIAPQALTMLNSALAQSSATALADRVCREVGSDTTARLRLAFRLALGRDPDAAEAEFAQDFLARDPSLSHFCLAILNTNEFVSID